MTSKLYSLKLLNTRSILVYSLLFSLLSVVHAQYPYTITMNQTMVGDATIVAKLQVVHLPGFEAKAGLNYHAYIDYNFNGSGTPYDPPPTPGVIEISPSDLNYIITRTPQVKDFNPVALVTCDKVSVTIQYLDGLGRIIQDVTVMGSSDQKDFILPYSYDLVGRNDFSFIPYASTDHTDGKFDPAYPANQLAFIGTLFGTTNENYVYTGYKYEESPLNRILKQSAPGVDWVFNSDPAQEHVLEFNFGSNQTTIDGWKWENNSFSQVSWSPGKLYMHTKKNENSTSNRTITKEYKDKNGRIVMVETLNDAESLKTRYVYDDLGQLYCVVPPKATAPASNPQITDLCYYYSYDKKKRMVTKKLPGAESVLMVYDKRDRLVMNQDGKMREEHPQWWFLTCYDNLNRPVMTGIYHHTSAMTQVQMQELFESITNYNENINGNYNDTDHGYTRNVAEGLGGGASAYDVLSVNYYDNYDFADLYGFTEVPEIVSEADILENPRNQQTGIKIRTLTSEANWRQWMMQAMYYDDKFRVVQTVGDHQLSNDLKDVVSTKFSFTGRLEARNTNHTAFEKTTEYTERFVYDHTGRLLEQTLEGLSDQPKIMVASLHYDRLGQLITKQIHTEATGTGYNPFAQKTDYLYNIRGWHTAINDPENTSAEDDIFAMKLHYNDALSMVTSQIQFNGNISTMEWATHRPGEKFAYRFLYDQVNRLTTGEFFRDKNGGYSPEDSFNEKNISYDANGNILSLDRYADGDQKIDQLTYSYLDNGNRISYVQDAMGDHPGLDYPGDNTATQDYYYDANGNMIRDYNKSISTDIVYSYLNKPELIDFGNEEKINYIYDGAGNKLAKKVINGSAIPASSMIYTGFFVYNWNGVLQYILTGEGRLVPDNKSYRVEYFMKDHLGNTRATYAQAAPGVVQVAEYQHYYPFGMQMEGLCSPAVFDVTNNQLYNGKELQPDYNLQWYDYGARFYDPQLGRFHTVDRFAEKYSNLSPYQYGANNPVLNIDVNGDSIWINYTNQNNQNQRLLYTSGMKYEGNDKFISSVVNSLNQMGNDKLGEEVISTLSGSENHYTFTNSYAKDSEGNVVDNALQYNDAAGEIHAAVLLNSNIQNSQKIESATHELFHGYQAEFGEKGSTINREVGAYLYGRSLVTNLGYGTLGFGDPSTTSGQTYNQAMNNLLFNFDQRQYNTAINTFKQGASVNVNGTYNHFIIKSNDSNPVIKKLYPLIR